MNTDCDYRQPPKKNHGNRVYKVSNIYSGLGLRATGGTTVIISDRSGIVRHRGMIKPTPDGKVAVLDFMKMGFRESDTPLTVHVFKP